MIQQTYGQYLNQLEEFYPLSVIAHFGPALMGWFKQGLTLPETMMALKSLRENGQKMDRIEVEYLSQEHKEFIGSLQSDTFSGTI